MTLDIGFPSTNGLQPSCGLLPINCDRTLPTIQLPLGLSGKPYEFINISYTNSTWSIHIKDFPHLEFLNTSECQYLINFTLPNSPFISFKLTTPNLTLYKCNRSPNITSNMNFEDVSYGEYDFYFNISKPSFASQCSILQLPIKGDAVKNQYELVAKYDLEIHISDACSNCYSRRGLCELGKEGNFNCSITPIIEKGIDIKITQNVLVLQCIQCGGDRYFSRKLPFPLIHACHYSFPRFSHSSVV